VAEATVSPDGLGDYPTIQEAIDVIDSGGVIYLTDGVFSGYGNINLDFGGKNFELRSQNLVPENCIIDCNPDPPRGEGRPSLRGVSFTSNENGLAMLTGITIRNGVASTGAAVLINGAHPVITYCNFENNSAGTDGGAIWLNNGNPTFQFCRFIDNSADGFGGAIEAAGSNVHSQIQDCVFIGNSAANGGAVDILTSAQLQFTRCQFFANSAAANGGAIFNETEAQVPTLIQYCTFSENSALFGSAINTMTSALEVWMTIVAFGESGSGFYLYNTARDLPAIYCTDSYGNVGGDWVGNMEPLLALNNNFSEDPQFCGGLGDGNLYLQSDSPCLPIGNDCHYQIGALPSNCGESASQAMSWTHLKSLY
jgi:predicted outer membrane repeat protein